MAIQGANEEVTQNNNTVMGEKVSSAFSAAGAGQQQQKRPTGSFSDLGTFARAPMGRNPTSEILSKLTKALEDSFGSMDKNFIATVIPVDRNNVIKLSFSVIIVALQEASKKDRVSFHTLILEGSSDPIAPRFENINNMNVEIMKVASDANDGVLMDTVVEQLRRVFPKADLKNADSCVVPTSFSVDDHNLVYSLGANAVLACFTELSISTPGFQDLNLANIDFRESTLNVRTMFGRNETFDAVGLPIRTDVQIDLVAIQQTRRDANSMNNGIDRQSQVSTVGGFVDLIWDPAVTNNNVYLANQQQQQQHQKYAARFIMTNLDPNRLLTIPAQLLALVSATTLRENNAWVGAFRPKALLGNEIDMHDIGGVGIEANFENNPTGFGVRTNTKSDTFRPEMLGQLVAATVKPGIIMSMDVPECGAQSWYNNVFSHAATSANAQQAIIKAADTLTDGIFTRKYFQANGRVVIDDLNRIHLGYYIDRQGVKRDIRDIDYLAVTNLVGDKDPSMIRDYSDTILQTQYPMPQRLAARKRIISGLTNDPVFTGFARRITFDPVFIDALTNACREAGLVIINQANFMDAGSFERSTGGFLSQATMGAGVSGLFNRGFDQFSNQNMMPNQYSRY